jgi:hypothetical protein
MESDSNDKSKDNKALLREYKGQDTFSIFDELSLLLTVWFRRYFCNHHALYQQLLDYGRNYVLPVGILFWIVFIIKQISNI